MQKVIFETSGKGLYTKFAKEVTIIDIKMGYCNDEKDFGELRVYFDREDWDVKHHNIIYTDPKFLSMLQAFLCEHGLDGNDVEYSEAGMQDPSYVSCDVTDKFISSWTEKFGEMTV